MKTPSAKAMAFVQAVSRAEESLTQISQKRRFVKKLAGRYLDAPELIAEVEDYMLKKHPRAKRMYAACLTTVVSHDSTGCKVRLDEAESLFGIDRNKLRIMAQAGTIPATKVNGRWHIAVGAMREQLRGYVHHDVCTAPETESGFDRAA